MTSKQRDTTSASAHPAARPVRRRGTDRVIAGVAGGIGDYFNVDPLLVRAAFVGLMIFGGAGLVLYVGAWLLIPVEGRDDSIAESALNRAGVNAGTLAVVAAVVVVLFSVIFGLSIPVEGTPVGGYVGIGGMYIHIGWFLVLAMVILGVMLLRRGAGARSNVAVAPPPGESHADPPGRTGLGRGRTILIVVGIGLFLFWFLVAQGGHWPQEFQVNSVLATVVLVAIGIVLLLQSGRGRSDGAVAERSAAVDAEPGSVAAALHPERYVARPRVARGPLGWYAIAAALLGTGLLAAVDNLTDATVMPGQFLGAALAIVGIGLVVGSWWGNARLLILPALLLVPIAVVASFVTAPLEGGTGYSEFRPTTPDEVRADYRKAIGELRVDLRDLEATGEPIRIAVSIGIGDMDVILPEGASVDVTGEVGAGGLMIAEIEHGGTSVSDRAFFGDGATDPDFILDLEVGIGRIEVWPIEWYDPTYAAPDEGSDVEATSEPEVEPSVEPSGTPQPAATPTPAATTP